MKIHFYKYQGTGNDFVMIDDRGLEPLDLSTEQVNQLCDRKFGIGADGLILLRPSEEFDFEMVYFNSDGRQSSMCGNGGRCILQFANDLGLVQELYTFMAIDGMHQGKVGAKVVSLQMVDVTEIEEKENGDLFLDTGSPHYVSFKSKMPSEGFVKQALAVRNSPEYKSDGVNVNFVCQVAEGLEMRTFERGVEDETLSCGTGVTAAAIASHFTGKTKNTSIDVKTAGGSLNLSFERNGNTYSNIWLTGPAKKVYKGEIELA